MYQNAEPDNRKSRLIIMGLLIFLGLVLLFKFKTGIDETTGKGTVDFGDSGSSSSASKVFPFYESGFINEF